MNEQEAIEEINNLKGLTILDKTINFDSEMISKKDVLNIVKQLNGPEKPTVPQYVADWIEWCKNNNVTLLGAMSQIDELGTAICDDKKVESLEASKWATRNQETFAQAWLFGYEVEKEKFYTVEIPNPNGFIRLVLCKDCDGKLFVATFSGGDCWETFGKCKLTVAEIKEDFEWAWQFAKEVEE